MLEARVGSKIGLVELPDLSDLSLPLCRLRPFRRSDKAAFAVEDSNDIVKVPCTAVARSLKQFVVGSHASLDIRAGVRQ